MAWAGLAHTAALWDSSFKNHLKNFTYEALDRLAAAFRRMASDGPFGAGGGPKQKARDLTIMP